MTNHIVHHEIIEVNVDPAQILLYLRVEAAEWTPTTEVRARLVGPRNALARTIEVAHPFKPLKKPEEDVGPEVRSFRVVLPEPGLWSPSTPCRYEGSVELWQAGLRVDERPLHYSVYMLHWEEGSILVNEEPFTPRVREVPALDEATVARLRADGVNVVVLPASASPAWELADRLGLFLLGMLPADGTLPEDLLDRSVRPCCLGWVFPSIETPLPSDIIPGLFGLRSDRPFTELPEGLDFLFLDAAPASEETLGYPWIAR